jgi:predicted phage terminase large subunit-like protein
MNIKTSELLNDAWKFFPDTFASRASNKKWIRYKHIKYISDKITTDIVRGGARFCISIPPRHGKSEFLSYWFPVWYLETFPDKRIILCSYAAELAASFGRKIRNEFDTNKLLTTKLSPDSTAAHRFDTQEKGGMITAGVGGPITGKGANLFLIDDPYKNMDDAVSENYRDRLQSWYESVARTRLEPGGNILVIMTRWHENDLAGHLIKNHGFTEIRMPAIAEEADCLGRAVGDPLCVERFGLSDLEGIRKDVGSYTWQALYQQNPIPVQGGLFKRKWWGTYRERPHFDRIVQFWDCAQKVGITNDYSVCATWGQTHNGYYLIDMWRNKVEAPQLEQAARNLYEKHRPSAVVIEDKSSGSSLIQSLKQKTTMPIIAYDPKSRDKEVRASASTPTVEAGKCFLPEHAEWVEDFIQEHERFPNATHDDQVDTTSMMTEFMSHTLAQPRITIF